MILYAGSYATSFSFKVSGREYKYAGDRDSASDGTKALPANTPKFTVWSVKPTVTIDSTSPNVDETYTTVKKNEGEDTKEETTTPSINGRTITIYPELELTEGGCGTDGMNVVRQAMITLTLSGLGNGTSASLKFTNGEEAIRLFVPNNNNVGDQTDGYAWTSGSENATRIIGEYSSGSCDAFKANPVGRIVSEKFITIEYKNGNTTMPCTVAIDPITIVQ